MTTTNTRTVMPTQWTQFKDVEDLEPLNADDHGCLSEIGAVLQKYGKQDRFGVTVVCHSG